MRTVAWTVLALIALSFVAATANAASWGRPGPGPAHGYPGYHGPHHPYPAWRAPVVVHRPAYVVYPRPAPVVVPSPVVVPAPPPPAWYGPSVGIQYYGRNFGLSIGF